MPQEMSFAQALTEARQIIVQQSNRIKSDLDKIKALQESINAQTAAHADNDRLLRQKTTELDMTNDQLRSAAAKLEELRVAKEHSEAALEKQQHRMSDLQQSASSLEKQLAEQTARADKATRELDSMRGQVPTQEDTEALAALMTLLSAKKGGAPAAPAAAPKPAEENTAAAA